MKICLIGNSGTKSSGKDGQTTKLRLYKKKIIEEDFELSFVDLENFFHNPFLVFRKIKKGVIECDRVVLISGERACKLLIPYINKYKVKHNKVFILPLVGSGVLHYSFDSLSENDKVEFLLNKKYKYSRTAKKIRMNLSMIDYILPETQFTCDLFTSYYQINNCYVLSNFREMDVNVKNEYLPSSVFKIVYLSRVMEEKGIFDILNAVRQLNNTNNVVLDIYGSNELVGEGKQQFNSLLDFVISYKGPINSDEVIKTISQYDLFVFPTRFLSEGVPGVISESLIAGTPILTSNFPNAPYLLKDGYDSIFYEMFNVDDLKAKLEWCINNKDKIRDMRKNCLESSKKFTYEYNRKDFLKYVCGVEEK